MMSTLEIDGRTFASIKEAAQLTSYSRDYVTRLAREGKIAASYIGRQWFVDTVSLKNYTENIALEQEARKRLLREERKQERRVREAVERKQTLRLKKASTLHARSLVVASLVLGLGLLSGVTAVHLLPSTHEAVNTNPSGSLPSGTTRLSTITPQAESMPAQTSAATRQAAAVSTTLPASPVAASVTTEPLGEVNEGVLLLPSNGNAADVSALFSDTVEVRTLSDGSSVVLRVDAAGNQIGTEVPFVVVPVTPSDL
jgi:excisionase family DNA binding protein